MLQDATRYMRARFEEPLLVTAGARGEVAGNAAAMGQARRLGARLVKGS